MAGNNRQVCWDVIALAGPGKDLQKLKSILRDHGFTEIHTFDVPDDYGCFPDTTGYTAENWEEMESDIEDGNLYKWMTKCMDVALEFTNRRSNIADKLGYRNINKTLHWPKFGGKIFAVTGHVTCLPPAYLM